jgi:hypothetical protein
MSKTVTCDLHGESTPAYVCSHLVGNPIGLGFYEVEPAPDEDAPSAWCEQCEEVRVAHSGWNEVSESLIKIQLICRACYNQAKIRNSHTSSSLQELDDVQWKCGSCDKWHTGPILDLGYDEPSYWSSEYKKKSDSMISADLCVIENRDFFVRGIIYLPIIGTDENFRWGVWGSLSEVNFRKLGDSWDSPERQDFPPMFSYLSNDIPEYPTTLNLKMYVHIQAPNLRPWMELEISDHPLSREYHHGITPARVKELMDGRVPGGLKH